MNILLGVPVITAMELMLQDHANAFFFATIVKIFFLYKKENDDDEGTFSVGLIIGRNRLGVGDALGQ